MKTKAIEKDTLDLVLMALFPENRLVCKVSLATGLRVSDVLTLKPSDLRTSRPTVTDSKTKKRHRVNLPADIYAELQKVCGKNWVFEGRSDIHKHRTRQAVYKDIQRAAGALRLGQGAGTHSMRKSFAVRKYNACKDLRKVKKLLLHESEAVTILYACADELAAR